MWLSDASAILVGSGAGVGGRVVVAGATGATGAVARAMTWGRRSGVLGAADGAAAIVAVAGVRRADAATVMCGTAGVVLSTDAISGVVGVGAVAMVGEEGVG